MVAKPKTDKRAKKPVSKKAVPKISRATPKLFKKKKSNDDAKAPL
jgi:hypothetical protein